MCVINRTREIADLVTNIPNAHGMYNIVYTILYVCAIKIDLGYDLGSITLESNYL